MSLHEPPDHSDNSHNVTDAEGPMTHRSALPAAVYCVTPWRHGPDGPRAEQQTHKGDLFAWRGSSLDVPKSMSGRRACRLSDPLYPFYPPPSPGCTSRPDTARCQPTAVLPRRSSVAGNHRRRAISHRLIPFLAEPSPGGRRVRSRRSPAQGGAGCPQPRNGRSPGRVPPDAAHSPAQGNETPPLLEEPPGLGTVPAGGDRL